jgi:hypothetical protein
MLNEFLGCELWHVEVTLSNLGTSKTELADPIKGHYVRTFWGEYHNRGIRKHVP